jgi:redox-sensitive bicupin YhaK (pirin superfamily)
MSNLDVAPSEELCHSAARGGMSTRLLAARDVPLGGVRRMSVSRTLPQRELPMVGAWCFLDIMGPQRIDMRVQPHPHIGLQTVTWPLAGQIRHRDSIGSDVVISPGELNVMTSGHGVAHSEYSLGSEPLLHALQLWVALPAERAGGQAQFEQLRQLPRYDAPGMTGIVFIGEFSGVRSPATVHSKLLGMDLDVFGGTDSRLPLRPDFEYAVMALGGSADVAGVHLDPGPLLYLGLGRSELSIRTEAGARILLLGGEPFPEALVMWWNFVGRSHEEIVAARADWEASGQEASGRFPHVAGHGSERIPAPPMPELRLTPRRRRLP